MINNLDLIKLLIDYKVLDKETIDTSNELAQKKGITLYSELIDSNLVSPDHLVKLVTEFLEYPSININEEEINTKVVQKIPERKARELGVLALNTKRGIIQVAISDPQNEVIEEELNKLLKRKYKLFLTTPESIMRNMLLYKKALKETFSDLIKQTTEQAKGNILSEAPIIKIIDTLLDYAIAERASDLHLEPMKKGVVVRYRIDGIMYEVIRLEKELLTSLVARFKIMARLKIDETRVPQDGRFVIDMEGQKISCRLSIMPSMYGEKAVVRILPESARVTTLEELGFTGISLDKIRESITKTMGIVLATGPTGSGKTSTLYSILRSLDSLHQNISTMEDPIEYEIPMVNQFQVNRDVGLTFAAGLRSLLRQDPDVMMVGEIRDKETAEIAMHSALTGHFVLSTLHTNNAAGVLPRLIDMGIEPYIIASAVNTVIAQRLVRTNCMSCLVSYTPAESAVKKLETIVGKDLVKQLPKQLYHGKGCKACRGIGYSGRIGLFEVLDLSDGIRDLIDKGAGSDKIQKLAVEEGMRTMMEDGVEKVIKGITTLEELLRVLHE